MILHPELNQAAILTQTDLQIFDHQDGKPFVSSNLIDMPEIHCFQWLPCNNKDPNKLQILAGTNVGQILQISLPSRQQKHSVYQPFIIEKRLTHVNIVHSQRQCNVISYNQIAKNLLAAGYQQGGEKHSSCLLVWDLNRAADKVEGTGQRPVQSGQHERGRLINTQSAEMVSNYKHDFKEVNDDVNALVWLPSSACEIMAATEDNVMVCDTRQTWTISRVIDQGQSRRVKSIKFDPFDSTRFATQSEDKVKIYDVRKTKGPIFIIEAAPKSRLAGFEWAQYRSGLLASWQEQSNIVSFWDLNQRELKDQLPTQPRLTSEVVVDSGDIWALAWRSRQWQSNETSCFNKFFVLSSNAVIEEHFFGDKSHHVFALSSRSQMCVSSQDHRTLHTLTLKDAQIDFKKLNRACLTNRQDEDQLPIDQITKYNKETNNQDISFVMLERLKAGYLVDSALYNLALSTYFANHNRRYTKQSEQATHYLGVRTFWEWIHKLKITQDRIFLSGIQVPLSEDSNREKVTSISRKLTLYKSDWRSNIIKFCGWTDQVKSPADSSKLEELCKQTLKLENDLKGCHMRVCVMAALHCDFKLALQLGSLSESKSKYNEDTTNMLYFINFLQNLKRSQASKTESHVPNELQIANIYSEVVNNPYLKLFYQLMLEQDINKVFEDCARGTTLINTFDIVALACKYLDSNQLKSLLQTKIESSIVKGNLDAIVITGLLPANSKQVQKVIQNFVDVTADVQTAAYVAAYATSAVQFIQPKQTTNILKTSKAIIPQLNPFKSYLHAYREYLNTLQLYNVRAKFDCAHNKGLFYAILPSQEVPSSVQKHELPTKVGKETRTEAQLLGDPFETRPFENQAKCGFCSSPLAVKFKVTQVRQDLQKASKNDNKNLDHCLDCQKRFPSCAVCLCSVSVLNPMKEFKNSQKQSQLGQQDDLNQPLDQWLLWCQMCKHGGHAGHIRDWFKTQTVCPLSSCECQCNSLV